jgi:hypothetical protein
MEVFIVEADGAKLRAIEPYAGLRAWRSAR